MGDWEGVRLHVVTGKGGTGKTTAASAVAIALATGGRRVLVVEVEGRQGLAQAFDLAPLTYEERRIAAAPGGGEIYGLAVDAREAMHEYLAMFYRLGPAARALDRFGFIEFTTTIAPGLRDVLLTGKTYEATRTNREGVVYDAVVLDAPPTGRITRFLDVNTSVTSLARVGPINRQANAINELFQSPRTVVHLVTLLEDMPVQETVDAINGLRDVSIPVGAVLVNQETPEYLGAGHLAAARSDGLDTEEIRRGLKDAGLPADDAAVALLTRDARDHAHRVAREDAHRDTIDELGRPVYRLPRYHAGIDPAALYELANELVEQGI